MVRCPNDEPNKLVRSSITLRYVKVFLCWLLLAVFQSLPEWVRKLSRTSLANEWTTESSKS